eukprot:CAMPEP_0172508066 /NCGR_PEP_ID=MMETSP1066-20121228/208974_1 /TAXON_ID=671091 /ORGANISM="Coscinodiscus wailesii, Strain CCMP2513" /LENGTH=35 /DNA_ID= /DNA_START= /DNA_END= /DNA_ORIENTATION=
METRGGEDAEKEGADERREEVYRDDDTEVTGRETS